MRPHSCCFKYQLLWNVFVINKNNRFTAFKTPHLEKLTHSNVHTEEEDTDLFSATVTTRPACVAVTENLCSGTVCALHSATFPHNSFTISVRADAISSYRKISPQLFHYQRPSWFSNELYVLHIKKIRFLMSCFTHYCLGKNMLGERQWSLRSRKLFKLCLVLSYHCKKWKQNSKELFNIAEPLRKLPLC